MASLNNTLLAAVSAISHPPTLPHAANFQSRPRRVTQAPMPLFRVRTDTKSSGLPHQTHGRLPRPRLEHTSPTLDLLDWDGACPPASSKRGASIRDVANNGRAIERLTSDKPGLDPLPRLTSASTSDFKPPRLGDITCPTTAVTTLRHERAVQSTILGARPAATASS
jgi:hypothetical protein